MRRILVSGLLNIETSVKVSGFPVEYCPIEYPFFGVDGCVSGVGYNVAKALVSLGDEIELVSEVGNDLRGEFIRLALEKEGISNDHVFVCQDKQTAESVVLVDPSGKRKIYCDLKDLQDRPALDISSLAMEDISMAVLTNINFNRKLLWQIKERGIQIATDVHVLSDPYDGYNADFLKAADILFLSNEAILGREGDFVKELYGIYHTPLIVVGRGEEGALAYFGGSDCFLYEKAVAPRGVVSTVGAGDALFSSFIHFLNKGEAPDACLKKAVTFAGAKIGTAGGSNGFLNEAELAFYL